jgi:formate hydrogenlyase subunit 6/NADH:ubiquinone oxidoreductase subunit I
LDKKPSLYWKNIFDAIITLRQGLAITWRHIWEARKSAKPTPLESAHYFESQQGISTVQYPHVSLPIPDNARYRLHNEIDDCIVCDKCAKICPVDCIDIEPIRSPEEFGKTSDGTPKRIYAAKFDIDMAKCCFCGLCTTVCPTECLTMTKAYDFSEFDVQDHTYAFAEMTPLEILEKKAAWEKFETEKQSAKLGVGATAARPQSERPMANQMQEGEDTSKRQEKPSPKPFIPKMKPVVKKPETSTSEPPSQPEEKNGPASTPPKPFIPRMKPIIPKKDKPDTSS